jgi:thioredoxin-related protein
MSRVTCPSCLTDLRVPEGWLAGEPVRCPNCARYIRVGEVARPADRSISSYWEQVRFDDVLAGAVSPVPPPDPDDRTAAAPPVPVPRPAAPPSLRWWLMTVTATSVGLSLGLVAALVVVLSLRGRPAPAPDRAAAPPTAVSPPSQGRPSSAPAPAPPTRPVAEAAAEPVDEATLEQLAEAALGPPPERPPQPPGPPPWTFDRWLQDFDQAQRQAADRKKDVLLLFDASDWSEFSQNLAREVFARPELWGRLTDRFVPVHIDFPEYPRGRRGVQDARRNEALQARFFKYPAYPRVVLADAEGRPFGIEWGYGQGKAEEFIDRLEGHRQKRQDRDELLAAVEAADGEAKLRAAEAALHFLAREVEGPTPREDGTYAFALDVFYAPLLRQWRALADTLDATNGGGYRERFFHADWGRRWRRTTADAGAGAEALRALAEEFDAWRAQCRFKDPDFAADLLCCQVQLHTKLGDPQGAERVVREALVLNPSAQWRRALAQLLQPKAGLSMGTGFVVAPGHVVTSDHVVRGTGPVRVRIQGQEPVGCTILAHDEDCDLALLKVELPPRVTLRTLRVAPRAPADRGTEVMALGYALGGASLKFTRGAVSARLADAGNGLQRLVLDQRINPGNSGGPLFDACGNVVGIVQAKTIATAEVDSYGIAVAAEALDRFLRHHLKDRYRPATPLQQKLDWAEIDRWVSPSVVLVLQESG